MNREVYFCVLEGGFIATYMAAYASTYVSAIPAFLAANAIFFTQDLQWRHIREARYLNLVFLQQGVSWSSEAEQPADLIL